MLDEVNAEDTSAKAKVREELLLDGLIDWVSLSLVDSRVAQQFPTSGAAEQQNLTLNTIRSMVGEGLFELGDRSGGNDQFKAFDEPLEESMRKIRNAYVEHHDDRLGWVFRYWLNLTEKGEQAATSTEYGRHIAQQVAEDVSRRRAQENGEAP